MEMPDIVNDLLTSEGGLKTVALSKSAGKL